MAREFDSRKASNTEDLRNSKKPPIFLKLSFRELFKVIWLMHFDNMAISLS